MSETIKCMKKRLREELYEQGIRPAELAEMVGVGTDTVNRYLSPYLCGGKLEMWLKFSEALGYEGLDWLMS